MAADKTPDVVVTWGYSDDCLSIADDAGEGQEYDTLGTWYALYLGAARVGEIRATCRGELRCELRGESEKFSVRQE